MFTCEGFTSSGKFRMSLSDVLKFLSIVLNVQYLFSQTQSSTPHQVWVKIYILQLSSDFRYSFKVSPGALIVLQSALSSVGRTRTGSTESERFDWEIKSSPCIVSPLSPSFHLQSDRFKPDYGRLVRLVRGHWWIKSPLSASFLCQHHFINLQAPLCVYVCVCV